MLFHAKELIGILGSDCLLDVQKRMVKQSRLLGDLGVGDSSSSSDERETEERERERPYLDRQEFMSHTSLEIFLLDLCDETSRR